MPANSIKQRRAFAIAEHDPDDLYARNRSLLKVDPGDMHDFAATSEKNLPVTAPGKPMFPSTKARRKRGM